MWKYFKEMWQDKAFQKRVLAIALPLMFQQLIVSSVNLVDNLMVGQLGDVALSAVSNANRYYMIVWAGVNGLIASATIFLAQFLGANNHLQMKKTFRFMLVSSYALCIVFFLLAFFMPEYIIAFFIKDVNVITVGSSYLRIAALSYLPSVLSLATGSAFRAMGETKLPLVISVSSVLINVVLNYCLIFGHFGFPCLGVEGAAVATLVARIVEMVVYLIALKLNNVPFKTRIKNLFKFESSLAKQITIKALPLCVNEVMWSFGMSTLLRAYSYHGLVVNTAYSMASTIADMFFVLFAGMATATTVLIGTSLGANRLDEARDNGYKLLAFSIVMAFVFLVLMYLSSFIAPDFYNVSIESKELARSFLQVMAVCFVLYMYNVQCYFILRAGGDTKSTLFMDSGFMWMFNIPLVFYLSYMTNVDIVLVYLFGQLTDIIKAFLSTYLVRKEKWVKNLTVME